MDSSHLETIQKDLEEIEQFISQSKRGNITRVLKEQKILLESSLKAEKNKLAELEKNKNEENSDNKNTNNSSEKSNINYTTISKYAFENSEKFAKVYFTEFSNLKSHDQSKITSDFRKNGFTVCIHDFNGKNLKFNCSNLNKTIVPEDSYIKTTSTGLIVYLRKEKSDFWDSLEKKKSVIGEEGEKPNTGLNKDDPSAGLMNMMKEMYQNGDENTKRMIAESWSKAQSGKGMDMGGMGGMPGMGGMGGMPGMGGMGGMPGMGGFGDMGGMGGMPDFSNMDFSKFDKEKK